MGRRKPNETYKRAWELLAKLRELKASAADVFKGGSQLEQQCHDYLDTVFDAYSAELAVDVDEDYRGTT